jgi:hypothetical protein
MKATSAVATEECYGTNFLDKQNKKLINEKTFNAVIVCLYFKNNGCTKRCRN